jgi:anaerobic selenocysteine-containing dehydrogenase
MFFWDLARRLGKQLVIAGQTLDMDNAPTSEALLDVVVGQSRIPLDEIRKHPHGAMFPIEQYIQPARPDNSTRFDVLPDDVADELGQYLAAARPDPEFTHLMTNRRARDLMNSMTPMPDRLEGWKSYNPAFMNSADLARQGITPGERIGIISDHGRLTAIAQIDDAVRPGVISMSHSRGGLPDDPDELAPGEACTQLLVSTESNCEAINNMPRMSSIPVKIERLHNS